MVAEASSGHEVVELYKAHRPDVTLTDVQMPPRLRLDRNSHFRISMAERGDANPRDEIQIAPSIGSYQPRTFSARNLQPQRRVRSLRQTLPKYFTEFAHRDATIMSRNAPPP